MAASRLFKKWSGRFQGALTFWSVLPSGLVGLIGGYLSAGVLWIRALGAWGIFMSGLVAFVLSTIAFALIARTKLWRSEARTRALLAGDSSPFDPMAPTYENKRLYLRDLAPAGRRFVAGRTFINCEIIGPGTIVVATRTSDSKPWPAMSETLMIDTDVVQMEPSAESKLAVGFPDCNFHGCKFFNLTLLFIQRTDGVNWNWITPDFRQPELIGEANDLTIN